MPMTIPRRAALAAILLIGCGETTGAQRDSGPTDSPPAVDAQPLDAAIPAPQASALAPSHGIVTTRVTVTGTHFGASQGTGTVTVGGTVATVTAWADTSITFAVPTVTPADVAVVVTTGGGAAATLTFHLFAPVAYVENNDGGDSISVLAFDPATGATTTLQPAVATGAVEGGYGGCSHVLAFHPGTRRLFVAGKATVSVFDIGPTGALTAVTGSPFAAGTIQGEQVVVNAAGTRVFVGDSGGEKVAVLDVAASGALTPVAGSPFAGQFPADNVLLSPDEAFLFVNGYQDRIETFAIAADGALSQVVGTQAGGAALVRRPGTDQIFVPNIGGTLGVWTIGAAGALTAAAGSPFTIERPSGGLNDVAFTPGSDRAYLTTTDAGYVTGYALDAAGIPTKLAGSPWTFTNSSASLTCSAVSLDGRFLVSSDETNKTFAVFTLDAAGTPTAVASSPFALLSGSPSALAITF